LTAAILLSPPLHLRTNRFFVQTMGSTSFAQTFHGAESPAAMTQVISMVLIIGVLGNGFFGAGMRAVQDRETNVLRRFKVAPISAGPIIVAAIVSGLVSFVPTVLFFFLFARVVYHMPLPRN